MPEFEVFVLRRELWSKSVFVEAENAEAAMVATQQRLQEEGWNAVMGDDDGDCEECRSDVTDARPAKE